MNANVVKPLQGIETLLGIGYSFLEDMDRKRKEADMQRTCCLCRYTAKGKQIIGEGKTLVCPSSFREVWVCRSCRREHPALSYREARNIEERRGYRAIRNAKKNAQK